MSTAFLGMRGTGEWVSNQQPEDYRESVLYLYPNGNTPLTAIMSMLGSRRVYDPTYNWWTKTLPAQGGAVTNVFTDPSLASAYTSGGVAGTTLYVNAAAAVIDEFRVGHEASPFWGLSISAPSARKRPHEEEKKTQILAQPSVSAPFDRRAS